MFYLLVFIIVHHVYTCITQVAARKQYPCPSNTRCWLRQFLVIYCCLDKGGGASCLPRERYFATTCHGTPETEVVCTSCCACVRLPIADQELPLGTYGNAMHAVRTQCEVLDVGK